MINFREQWQATVAKKQSLLCVGIDAAEAEQRGQGKVPAGVSKVDWTLGIVASVAPYAAAIKLNRNYYKDIARHEMQEINAQIHRLGMLSIDDCKLADIGDTNDAGIYHARVEGFDALTYAPFPGNTLQAAAQAKTHGIGLIALVLMSNPEFGTMKNARFGDQPFYMYLAQQCAAAQTEGIVIGAPSASNHIAMEEIAAIAGLHPQTTVLVPGIGAQGGELGPILEHFGSRTIANVGRAIIYAADPAREARAYRDMIESLRASAGKS